MATGLAAVVIWLWMARRVKRGRRGARTTAAAVLFVINTIAVFSSDAEGIPTHLTFMFALAEWGVGLIAVVFLWDRRSSQYFTELRQARSLAVPEWPKATMPHIGGRRNREG